MKYRKKRLAAKALDAPRFPTWGGGLYLLTALDIVGARSVVFRTNEASLVA